MFSNNYCGVYLITVIPTGQFYVGSASNMPFRRDRHLKSLRKGSHHNLLLQAAFDAHGESALEFSVIGTCSSRRQAYQMEADEIEKRATSSLLLNIGKASKGGDNLTNHPNRLDVIARTSATSKARIALLSDEERRRCYGRAGERNGMQGRQHTQEARAAMSLGQKGNQNSAGREMPIEQKKVLSALASQRTGDANPFFGRKHSQISREKMSASQRLNPTPPASRKAVKVGSKVFQSIREAMSETGLSRYVIKQRLADPAYPHYQEIA